MTETVRSLPPLPRAVAAEIRAEVARRQITQARLAEVLGISAAQVSQRFKERTPFSLADVEKIANALDLPVTHFIPAEAVTS